jgi:hypothetical protein
VINERVWWVTLCCCLMDYMWWWFEFKLDLIFFWRWGTRKVRLFYGQFGACVLLLCMMVSDLVTPTQNYWVFGFFFHRLMFLGVETWHFRNWICFRPQAKGGEDTYSVGPLRKRYSQSLDSPCQIYTAL